MCEIFQSEEGRGFGRGNLRKGCQEQIYETLTTREAEKMIAQGNISSSAVVV